MNSKSMWLMVTIFVMACSLYSLFIPQQAHASTKPTYYTESSGASWSDTLSLPSTDIVIDVGHGGIDGGTNFGEILEKQVNLEIALKLYELLIHSGIRTAINRSSDYALSDDNDWLQGRSRHLRDLSQRKLLAETLSPKLVVSLHANWAKRTTKSGGTVLFQMNPHSHLAAHLIQGHLNVLYGKNEIPYLGKPFYLLNHSPSPAVIVEMGFISNPSDRLWLTTPEKQQKIAEAIASAISEYLITFAEQPSHY